jgi:uncharacterized protein YigE (DUF2233 family)
MAVNVTVHPALEALLDKIGRSGIGHATDGTRSFVLSKVQAEFDLVAGATAGTQDVAVLLRLRNTADSQQWPYAVEPTATFDFSTIVGDV